ncbi:MAG: UvrD-helicase domain-containing protein [Bacteroidales bacterium]|nr:UvrD-helicase domain-containing protein [Bacteroidales bacterium]
MSKIKIYKASAGSGKTYTLAKEYIKQLLIAPSYRSYRHILAVTFTKDATGEMLDRILAELYGLAFHTNDSEGFFQSISESLKEDSVSMTEPEIRDKAQKVLHNILHDYSRLNITTIDSFFQKVLRNLARELGKGSKYNLEMNTNKVLKEAVHTTIEKANKNKQLLEWLTTYIEHKMNEDKNWRIENEIYEFSKCIYNEFFQEHEQLLRKQLHENPKIFIRIRKQQEEIKKEGKEFFTHTNSQVSKLLEDYSLSADDFIRKGIPILFFRKLADGNYNAEVNKTIQSCCSDAESWTSKTHKKRNDIIQLAEAHLMNLLVQSLEVLKTVQTAQMITGNLHQLGLIWDISEEITKENKENNRFMLSDTALFLNQMIDNSDAPFIYEKISSDIHHVMIDEFQDTSRLQWKNFKALLSNIIANDNFSLMVGDVKQSIYRWRNGDWRILSNIHSELHCSPEILKYNYRSEKQIIHFNNSFFTRAAKVLEESFKNNFEDTPDSLFSFTYNNADVEQECIRKERKGFVSVHFLPDKKEEIPYPELMKEAVFEQIRQLSQKGIEAHSICILTRTNKDIIVLADYLSNLKKDYPELEEKNYLNIISNEAFQLQSSPTIKILIETLKVIADPENVIHKEQLLYYLGNFNIQLPENFYQSLLATGQIPLFELIGHLYREMNLYRIKGQSSYLFSFYDAVSKYLNEKPSDLTNFLAYWENELKIKTIPTGSSLSGIQAMTIHKSKGLQFDTVIIPYCDWSINPKTSTTIWCPSKEGLYSLALLPVSYSSKMKETIFTGEYREETEQTWMDNLNILYVGFTRAERNLILLSRYKKNLEKTGKISTTGDLLQSVIPALEGSWDGENKVFSMGVPESREKEKDNLSDNPFKQIPESIQTEFISSAFHPDKPLFKQSNKSREFIQGEAISQDQYISYGNIMHSLFERITHIDDLEKIIDSFITDGLLTPEEKDLYKEKIQTAIDESETKHWFDGTYKSYSEYSLIIEDNGEVVSKRPDRVLFSEKETIVIDYKFGKPHSSHQKQIKEYMSILQSMNYPDIKGYLWYVEERKKQFFSLQ